MPSWARMLTLAVVISTWVATVGVWLVSDQLPDAALLGVPAATVLALAAMVRAPTGGGGQ